jgi:hypothetical protein
MKKVAVLLALLLALIAVVGSGALSWARLPRDLDAAVVKDSTGYVKLRPAGATNSGNALFAHEGVGSIGGDLLYFDFGAISLGNSQGQGLNPRGEEAFDDVFDVCNWGTQTLSFWFDSSEGDVKIYDSDGAQDYPNVSYVMSKGNGILLVPGACNTFGFYFDTRSRDTGADFHNVEIVIRAD